MEIKEGPEFRKSLRRMWWRQLLEPLNPNEYRRKLKWFWQRGKRGYSDADVWNAHSHISTVIAGMSRHLADHADGYPANPWDKKHELTMAKWQKVLRDIAKGFEAFETLIYDYDLHPDSARSKKLQAEWDNAIVLLKKWYGGMWD